MNSFVEAARATARSDAAMPMLFAGVADFAALRAFAEAAPRVSALAMNARAR